MNLQFFRKNLRNTLKERRITLNALSIEADLSEDTLRSIIYGQSKDIKLSTITKIADVLDCSIDSLIGRNPFSFEEEKMINQLRHLSEHSKHSLQTIINLEEKTTLIPSTKNIDNIPIYIPIGNLKDGMFYDNHYYEPFDITNYPDSIKKYIDYGFKITTSSFEPIYYTNDVLLISQKFHPQYNDIILYLDFNSQIYLRRKTPFGLEPLNKFGKKITPKESQNYTPIGVILKVVKEFDIEQYR